MKYIIHKGLLWGKNTSTSRNIVNCLEADKIANANDFIYIERLINHYPDGTILYIDKNLKIKTKGESVN